MSTPPVSRRSGAVGAAAQVTGVVGIVICVLLAVGVLIGRAWALNRVDEVHGSVDARLARGAEMLGSAAAKVSETSARAATVASNADAAARNPASALIEGLVGDQANVSERYLELRTAYATARLAIDRALERIDALHGVLPFVSVPPALTEALASLDATVQELDARVMELLAPKPASGPVSGWATGIANAAGRIQAALTTVSARLDTATARVNELRAQTASAVETTGTVITVATIVAVLLLLYLALLHAVLYRTGRAIRRAPEGDARAGAAPAIAEPAEAAPAKAVPAPTAEAPGPAPAPSGEGSPGSGDAPADGR